MKCYCINLDSRADRWQECINEYLRIGLPSVSRVSARIERGHLQDCAADHANCVALSLLQHDEMCLIMEDDVAFTIDKWSDVENAVNELTALDPDWDMLYLGINADPDELKLSGPPRRLSNNLYRVFSGFATHTYIVRASAFQKIIEVWRNHCHLVIPHDVVYSRVLLPAVRAYCVNPLMALQRPSFSQHLNRHTSYDYFISRWEDAISLGNHAVRQAPHGSKSSIRIAGECVTNRDLAEVAQDSLTPQDASPSGDGSGRIYLPSSQGRLLYIDGVFYQWNNTGIARYWNEIFRHWSRKYADRVVILDRGGEIQDFGIKRIPFKRFDYSNLSGEIQELSSYLSRQGAYRFASTYYTFSVMLPVRAIIYDMIPEILGYNPNSPPLCLKQPYLERAESALAISRQTMLDTLKFFPKLAGQIEYIYPGVSPIFTPLGKRQRKKFRKEFGVTAKYLITIPCALAGYKDGITALRAIDQSRICKDSEVFFTAPLHGQEVLLESLRNVKIRVVRMKDADYANLIASSDLVVWPPLIEGFGLPPLEAIACHTNVVMARTAINMEIYGTLANYAEPSDVESFSQAIEQSLNKRVNPELVKLSDTLKGYEKCADRLFAFLYR
ncbi:hypothetical protein CCP4SC76_5180028 [Gammaproteobacteria bacterium]